MDYNIQVNEGSLRSHMPGQPRQAFKGHSSIPALAASKTLMVFGSSGDSERHSPWKEPGVLRFIRRMRWLSFLLNAYREVWWSHVELLSPWHSSNRRQLLESLQSAGPLPDRHGWTRGVIPVREWNEFRETLSCEYQPLDFTESTWIYYSLNLKRDTYSNLPREFAATR